MTTPGPIVGIDVAKAELVVAVRPVGERWSVPNDETGVERLPDHVRGLAPTLTSCSRRRAVTNTPSSRSCCWRRYPPPARLRLQASPGLVVRSLR